MRVEFCGLDAAHELMEFIRIEWSAGHVLSRSRELLDWQHRDDAAGRYNFLIARAACSRIVGILGFIPSSRYDPSLAADRETIWLTTWKVVPGTSAGLGLVLLRELARQSSAAWIGTVGLNPATRGIYAALGYRTGALDRYYRLNPAVSNFRLATVPADQARRSSSRGAICKRLARDTFLSSTEGLGLDGGDQSPAKSRLMFLQRYLNHPVYSYRAHLLVHNGAHAIVITRICTWEDACALRVVDFIGDETALCGAGEVFDQMMAESAAEYVDFYCSSGGESLELAGFGTVAASEGLVLPGYFEPFVSANVDILYSIKGSGDRLVICKGDCDQDRPNMLSDQ